jgi:ribosomal protein S18 acetylase RimI-like enzyme
MDRAKQMAKDSGASKVTLLTATDNVTAQSLYEKLGYERETAFYGYNLRLTN